MKPVAMMSEPVLQISKDESIECSFEHVDGYLYPHDEARSTYQALEAELAAARKAGLSNASQVDLGELSLKLGPDAALIFQRMIEPPEALRARGLSPRHFEIVHSGSGLLRPVSCFGTC